VDLEVVLEAQADFLVDLILMIFSANSLAVALEDVRRQALAASVATLSVLWQAKTFKHL
jgi:hypothetical protein